MRFRLRTILVAVTLAVCCLAGLNYRANRHLRQRQAVAQISRLGGRVAFVGGSRFEPPPPDHAFAELTCWINDAIRPRTAWKVMFSNYRGCTTSVVDDDLPSLVSALKHLPNLTEVRFLAADVTRSGVRQLRGQLPNVEITAQMMKPEPELTAKQRLDRELRLAREHYQRKGWSDEQLEKIVEEFRRDWHELRDWNERDGNFQ